MPKIVSPLSFIDSASSRTLARSNSASKSDAGPANTTAETTLATTALPTTLHAGDHLRWVLAGDALNNTGSSQSHTAKFYIGATLGTATLWQTLAINAVSTNANRRQWRFTIDAGVNATNDEWLVVDAMLGPAGATPSIGSGTLSGCAYGTAAEDLTAGRNLYVTVILGVASASCDWIKHAEIFDIVRRLP